MMSARAVVGGDPHVEAGDRGELVEAGEVIGRSDAVAEGDARRVRRGSSSRIPPGAERFAAATSAASFDAPLRIVAGPVRVDASTLSRLQSSLLTSMSFMMSRSLTLGGVSVSSAAGVSGSSSAGGVWAAAATIEAKPMPAASIGSRAQPNRILGIIARPHSKSRPECVRSVAKLWRVQ